MITFIFLSGLFFNGIAYRKNVIRAGCFLVLYIFMELTMYATDKILLGYAELNLIYETDMPWFFLGLCFWYLIATAIAYLGISYFVALPVSIIVALAAGFFDYIGPTLVLSRTIVFLPCFILGIIVDKNKLMELLKKPAVRFASVIVLVIAIAVAFIQIDALAFMNMTFTGHYPYSEVTESSVIYGMVMRAAWYIAGGAIGFAFLSVMPQGKTPLTELGSRTISVYTLHIVVIEIIGVYFRGQHMWMYLIISIVTTLVLSNKYIYLPFDKFMSLAKK